MDEKYISDFKKALEQAKLEIQLESYSFGYRYDDTNNKASIIMFYKSESDQRVYSQEMEMYLSEYVKSYAEVSHKMTFRDYIADKIQYIFVVLVVNWTEGY